MAPSTGPTLDCVVEGSPAGICPAGSDPLNDRSTCENAAILHGRVWGVARTWPTQNGIPVGCWMFQGSNTYDFNTNSGGCGGNCGWNSNVQYVCLRRVCTTPPTVSPRMHPSD
eukprot:gene3260-biopygen6497